MIKTDVYNAIKGVVGDKNFALLTPRDSNHGDYAVHQSAVSGKQLTVGDFKNELFSKVEQIGDFINFTIHPRVLEREAFKILEQKEAYGSIKQDKPKKINLEFGQPNTHKLPHIGHLFSYIYGESLARILEFCGNEVFRCNYQGDVGLHVAKCLYQVRSEKLKAKGLKTVEEKVQFLQTCYQEGSKAYEEDPQAKQKIDELNTKIFTSDPEIFDLWQETRSWSVEYYKAFERKLGISFDRYFFETESGPVGKKIVQEHVGSVFEESDGAVIFRGEKYGLHTRVFITKAGNPTYEAKDIGAEYLKYHEGPFDQAIITTASEQNAYFKVVFKALEELFEYMKGKLTHIGFGMVDLKMGKMSSRTGNIVSAIDLVMLVEKEVEKLSSEEKNTEPVSLAAIKYSFLKSEARKNISFDLKESIATHGNSGPYLLYAYARCMSILKKANSDVIPAEAGIYLNRSRIKSGMTDVEELALLRTFFKFPEAVEDAARNFVPHLIATYIFDLAQKFNAFYEKLPILKAETDERERRLLLVQTTAQILKNGLHLLGIETLEKI